MGIALPAKHSSKAIYFITLHKVLAPSKLILTVNLLYHFSYPLGLSFPGDYNHLSVCGWCSTTVHAVFAFGGATNTQT